MPLTWGRGSGRARRGGLTFGSYDPVLGLIRIHPVLDRRDVPLYFLESVVYHEMLHHHLGGVPDRAGRTVYHSRAFREAEARYPWHRQALAWEKDNLPHLLAGQPGAGPRAHAPDAPRPSAREASKRSAPPPAAPPLPRAATGGAAASGCCACSLTTAFSVASPWVLRHAIDDLTTRRHPAEALALRGG